MYAPRSRYVRLAPQVLIDAQGGETPFTPALRPIPRGVGNGVIRLSSADRPDLIAARVCGDPTLFWRIADANAITDPFDLTREPRRTLRVPAGD